MAADAEIGILVPVKSIRRFVLIVERIQRFRFLPQPEDRFIAETATPKGEQQIVTSNQIFNNPAILRGF